MKGLGNARWPITLAVVFWLSATGALAEETRYLLRLTREAARHRVYRTYGLTEVRNVAWLHNLHVVTGSRGVAPARFPAGRPDSA